MSIVSSTVVGAVAGRSPPPRRNEVVGEVSLQLGDQSRANAGCERQKSR
jgi:hypothetical protein